MQQSASCKSWWLEIVIGGVDLCIGAGLLPRPAAPPAPRAELTLLYGLPAHGLHEEQQDRLAPVGQ